MFGLDEKKTDGQLADELRSILMGANKVGNKLRSRGYDLKYEVTWDTHEVQVKVQKISVESI